MYKLQGLKEILKQKSMTQKELASIVGVSYQTISNYHTGFREPSFKNIVKITQILDCSYDYLITGINNI